MNAGEGMREKKNLEKIGKAKTNKIKKGRKKLENIREDIRKKKRKRKIGKT